MKFNKYILGDVVDIRSSKRVYFKDYVEKGIPFYRSKEIILRSKGMNIDNPLYISQEKFDELKNKYGVPKENDILLTSVGTIGIPYLVKKSDEFYFKDGNLTWFSNFSKDIAPRYLLYWFQSEIGKKAIDNIVIGSTQKALTMVQLKKINIELPSIDIQKKIINIINSLDSKIELNNQMIATLEELAATLFKRWFVDFEFPDENGNPYKSSGGKMVDSELGEIPEGWSTTTLGSQVSFEYGKSLTKSQRNFGTIPVYGSNGIVDYHDKELVSGPGIIIGRKGTVGTVNFSSKDFFPIDTTFWVKILTDTKPINYFYFLLKNLNLDNLTSDSAVPGLNRNTALRTEIVVPTERIINHFERTVETFRYLSDEIEDNIGLLGDVRDSLLPKILSGEIEV